MNRKTELAILCTITGVWLLWKIITSNAILLYLSLPVSMQVYTGIILTFGILFIPVVLLIAGDFADWHFAMWAVMIAKRIDKLLTKLSIKMKGIKK